MKKLRILARTVALALLGGLASLATAEVVVVVSAANPLTSLPQAQVANIFLGRSGYLSGDQRALVVDQVDGSATREAFYRYLVGWSAAQVKAHWSKMVFTGRGKPPRQLEDDTAVIAFIAAHPDAIGYMQRDRADSSVKILTLTR
jgi:ABC-type phosphate transport system substrate-binding protein